MRGLVWEAGSRGLAASLPRDLPGGGLLFTQVREGGETGTQDGQGEECGDQQGLHGLASGRTVGQLLLLPALPLMLTRQGMRSMVRNAAATIKVCMDRLVSETD